MYSEGLHGWLCLLKIVSPVAAKYKNFGYTRDHFISGRFCLGLTTYIQESSFPGHPFNRVSWRVIVLRQCFFRNQVHRKLEEFSQPLSIFHYKVLFNKRAS
jgi:hypothetical protein